MKREKLTVEKRTIAGKQVKKLRREGILPANVYGKDIKSQSVQLPLKTFKEMFKKVHETGLVDIEFDGESLPVLIHNVQFNPRTQEPLHADFYKVNLKEKITAKVPIVAVGEPQAVADKIGLLLQPMGELEVEALPTDLPEKIEVNVESLKDVDQAILVSDLKMDEGVTVISDGGQTVFKIGELVTKEMEEQAAADEAAAEAASAETAEGEAEGEKPAEGEEKTPEEGGEEPGGEQKAEEPQPEPQQ